MSLTQREYQQKMITLLREAEELAERHLEIHPTQPEKVRIGFFRHATIRPLSEITLTFNQDGESDQTPLYVNDKGRLVYWQSERHRWLRVLTPDETPSWTVANIIYDLKRGFTLGAFY